MRHANLAGLGAGAIGRACNYVRQLLLGGEAIKPMGAYPVTGLMGLGSITGGKERMLCRLRGR